MNEFPSIYEIRAENEKSFFSGFLQTIRTLRDSIGNVLVQTLVNTIRNRLKFGNSGHATTRSKMHNFFNTVNFQQDTDKTFNVNKPASEMAAAIEIDCIHRKEQESVET